MKKVLRILVWVFSILVALGLSPLIHYFTSGNLEKSEMGNDESSFRAALILSSSKDASSLSTAAYEALMAQREAVKSYVSIRENVLATDLEFNLRKFAMEGYELVYVSSGIADGVVATVAGEYPDASFILLGGSLKNDKNLGSISVDYRAAGFIKGVFAAYFSKTNNVAGVGSDSSIDTVAELAGFQRGVAYVNPSIQMQVDYASNRTDKSAANLLASFVTKGADMVCSVAGSKDEEVFDLAETKKVYGLSDSEIWYKSHPSTVIMATKLDVSGAVEKVNQQVYDKVYKGDVVAIPLVYSFNPALKARIPALVDSKVKTVYGKMMSGELKMNELVPMGN